MKTVGLIGGTSWVSTIDYYRLINQLINERLGGLNSAKLLLWSVNFEEFKNRAESGNWTENGILLSDIAKRLEQAGADCIMLCANTPHIVADIVQSHITIPLLHIAEETAKEIARQKINTVGLLGTKFTMEHAFFKERLSKYSIATLIPEPDDCDYIHASIFNELGKGIFKKETKTKYLEIIETLRIKGAEGIIFGCTEIPMLIKPEECSIVAFDTTMIHARAAVEFALS